MNLEDIVKLAVHEAKDQEVTVKAAVKKIMGAIERKEIWVSSKEYKQSFSFPNIQTLHGRRRKALDGNDNFATALEYTELRGGTLFVNTTHADLVDALMVKV